MALEVLQTVKFQRENGAIRAVALQQAAQDDEVFPPNLTFVSPLNGRVIDSTRPMFQLAYQAGSDTINFDSLRWMVNGGLIHADCQYGEASIRCVPQVDLPLGENYLTATVEDVSGQVSNTAQVMFNPMILR